MEQVCRKFPSFFQLNGLGRTTALRTHVLIQELPPLGHFVRLVDIGEHHRALDDFRVKDIGRPARVYLWAFFEQVKGSLQGAVKARASVDTRGVDQPPNEVLNRLK